MTGDERGAAAERRYAELMADSEPLLSPAVKALVGTARAAVVRLAGGALVAGEIRVLSPIAAERAPASLVHERAEGSPLFLSEGLARGLDRLARNDPAAITDLAGGLLAVLRCLVLSRDRTPGQGDHDRERAVVTAMWSAAPDGVAERALAEVAMVSLHEEFLSSVHFGLECSPEQLDGQRELPAQAALLSGVLERVADVAHTPVGSELRTVLKVGVGPASIGLLARRVVQMSRLAHRAPQVGAHADGAVDEATFLLWQALAIAPSRPGTGEPADATVTRRLVRQGEDLADRVWGAVGALVSPRPPAGVPAPSVGSQRRGAEAAPPVSGDPGSPRDELA